MHVLAQRARIGKRLATVVERAHVRQQLARFPPFGVLWALIGDPLAKRDLARQRLLYDQPVVPVARDRNIVALLTVILWCAGASCVEALLALCWQLVSTRLLWRARWARRHVCEQRDVRSAGRETEKGRSASGQITAQQASA